MASTPDIEGSERHEVVHLEPEEWVTDVQQIDDEDSTNNQDSTVRPSG